ncbi:MAG: amidohydrolase family protein [Pseudomonadota bacterium]
MGILNRIGIRPAARLAPIREGTFIVAGVRVWNPGEAVSAPVNVEIAGGTVTRVAASGDPAQDEFAGCTVTPGFTDMHVHLPPDNALRLTPLMSLLYLSHGVTSIRDAGDLDGTSIDAARRLQDAGQVPVPRLSYCGPFVVGGKPTFSNSIVLQSPDEAAGAARRVRALGATFLKSYDGLSLAMIRALDVACAREGLKIMGHVPADLSYEDARVQEVQHFFGCPEPATLDKPLLPNRTLDWHAVDDARMQFLVDTTMKHGIANTPTMVMVKSMLSYENFEEAAESRMAKLMPPFYREVVWHPDYGRINARVSPEYLKRRGHEALRKKQQLTRLLFEAGAPVYVGTDTAQPFLVPGASLLDEFRLFVEAGIGITDVWKLATQAAGERLGVPGLGRVSENAPADLLIFKSDPSRSVPDPEQLVGVVAAGRLYRKRDLDRAIRNYLDFYESPIVRRMANRAVKQVLAKLFDRAA